MTLDRGKRNRKKKKSFYHFYLLCGNKKGKGGKEEEFLRVPLTKKVNQRKKGQSSNSSASKERGKGVNSLSSVLKSIS